MPHQTPILHITEDRTGSITDEAINAFIQEAKAVTAQARANPKRSQPSMRTLVLAELTQALKDGPLAANLDDDEHSITTPAQLRALDNEALLLVLLTMTADC